MENIVTEEEDRKEEEQRIRSALKECGYPKWAMDRVKQQITDRPQKPTATKKDNSNKSRGMVVIPYVEGVSEKIKRIYSKHNIHTAMRPTNTLKSILVHPKDKREITDTSDVVYDIPCGGCEKSYIGRWNRETIWNTPQRTSKGRWKNWRHKIHQSRKKSFNKWTA